MVIVLMVLEVDVWDIGLMVFGLEKVKEVVCWEGLVVYMIIKEGDSFKIWMLL